MPIENTAAILASTATSSAFRVCTECNDCCGSEMQRSKWSFHQSRAEAKRTQLRGAKAGGNAADAHIFGFEHIDNPFGPQATAIESRLVVLPGDTCVAA